MNIKEMRYKEELPEKTVKKLKKILKDNGIKVCEKWQKQSSVGTYALRLYIKDVELGQNGKGMTKDFAAASAYAEFFERYQNGLFRYRAEKPTKELPFTFAPDEKRMSVKDLVEENTSFFKNILKDNEKQNLTEQEKLDFFEEIFSVDTEFASVEKEHISIPYFSLQDNRIVHIPYLLFGYLCGSNGMCAGNSPEEAMIEGISEILERYVSMKLFYDKLAFPEIPDSYLEKFPTVKNMLFKMRDNKNYVCKLVDCSLGGKYPVAGLFVIQKNTGRFGFKLGAHPDYGIAMERCFTEAAQGIDIYDYAKSCLFDFDNSDVAKNGNVREFLDTYVANIPYEIWQKESTYKFTEIQDVSNLNNSQILNQLVDKIISDGYDILVRDVSVFGFPSYSIIIPGMSEISHGPMASRFNMYNTLSGILKNLNKVNMDNIKDVIAILETQIYEMGIESLSMYAIVKDISIFPCESFGMGCKFFLSICYIMNKQYDKAAKVLENIVFLGDSLNRNKEDLTLARAVHYYASGMNELHNHYKVMHYMDILFDENTCNYINRSFSVVENIIRHVYPITADDFVENDDAYYLPFMDKYRHKQKDNPINQLNNRKIFNRFNNEDKLEFSCLYN